MLWMGIGVVIEIVRICGGASDAMEVAIAGASEVAYSLLMMDNDFIAPNINFENPDEDSEKINVVSEYTEKKIDTFLSNSFGFGGTNSSLIVKKFVK